MTSNYAFPNEEERRSSQGSGRGLLRAIVAASMKWTSGIPINPSWIPPRRGFTSTSSGRNADHTGTLPEVNTVER